MTNNASKFCHEWCEWIWEAWVEFYIDKVKCLKWLIVTFVMHFEAHVVLGTRISNTATISFNHSLMMLLDIKAKVVDQSFAWSS